MNRGKTVKAIPLLIGIGLFLSGCVAYPSDGAPAYAYSGYPYAYSGYPYAAGGVGFGCCGFVGVHHVHDGHFHDGHFRDGHGGPGFVRHAPPAVAQHSRPGGPPGRMHG